MKNIVMHKIIMHKNVTNLGEHERLKLIHQLDIDESVFNYLKAKLKNLSIEIGGDYEGNVIELMNNGLLEGWCWQTTESSIVFFNDDDCIERGNLKFGVFKKYWHSWICFTFNGIIWVFDPCLQIIVEKNIYYHIFEINEIAGSVTAKSVRDELIYRINHREIKNYNGPKYSKFLAALYTSERQENETQISGNNDVKSAMYRNNTGYTATIENGTINTLIAHYYFNG